MPLADRQLASPVERFLNNRDPWIAPIPGDCLRATTAKHGGTLRHVLRIAEQKNGQGLVFYRQGTSGSRYGTTFSQTMKRVSLPKWTAWCQRFHALPMVPEPQVSALSSLRGPFYMGIDPGVHGAIALLDNEGTFVHVWDMPTLPVALGSQARIYDERGLHALLAHRELMPPYRPIEGERPGAIAIHVIMERVQKRPGESVHNVAHRFYGAGLLIGMLTMTGRDISQVDASVWKRAMNLTDEKARSITLAQERWPHAATYLVHKSDDGRAEALWIAEYGRLHGKAVLSWQDIMTET